MDFQYEEPKEVTVKNIILLILTLIIVGACSTESFVDEKNLHKHIKILSSDEFGGRAPGSEGGEKTKDYIKEEFLASGLVPIKDNYFLDVPLSKMVVDVNNSSLNIETRNGTRKLIAGSESVFWSKQVKEEISIDSSELVFIGYGVIAPEYDWNDYKDIDVTGKTLAAASDIKLKKAWTKIEMASKVGEDIAKKITDLKVKEIVFDRGWFAYHGRVKALAESIRANKIKF